MRVLKEMPIIVHRLFELLHSNGIEYAVLRNYDGLPFKNKSRDVDILVRATQYPVLRTLFGELICQLGYKLVTLFESERLRTFVCADMNQTEALQLVQFDFFVHTSAYGNILLTADDLLSSRVCTNGIWHVSKEFEFLDKYLYLKYIGTEYPKKYKTLKSEMETSRDLEKILNRLYGVLSLRELENMPCHVFRKICKKRNCASLGNVWLFWMKHFRNMFFHKGYSMAFSGTDEVGITAVIEGVVSILRTVYPEVVLYHHRPYVLTNMGEVASSAGLKTGVDRDFCNPYRGSRANIMSSLVRLAYYFTDYAVGYCVKIKKQLSRRNIVIFDRYYTDIICDGRLNQISLPHTFLYWFGKFFIPSVDYNILLAENTTRIPARIQDLDEEEKRTINERIDYLAAKPGYFKVVNEGTQEEVIKMILEHVFSEQHHKNIKEFRDAE